MTKNERTRPLAAQWLVDTTGPPLIYRRCLNCRSARYRADGTFRVNANGKLLDVWLLARCVGCGSAIKLTVLERVPVRAIDPPTLARFHDNDADLAATLLADPGLLRRNGVTVDWDGSWALQKPAVDLPETEQTEQTEQTETSEAQQVEIAVRFVQPIPIKVTALLSAGMNVSRSEVRRRIAAGTLSSAHRLTGTASGDFSFTLRR